MEVMETVRTIGYDDKTLGRKVLTFPPEMPFADHSNQLLDHLPTGEAKTELLKIAILENVFKRTTALADYVATSSAPHEEMLRVAALAMAGEPAGLKLIYAALVAFPPAEVLIASLVDFRNVRRVMAQIERKERLGKALKESEEWFKKKVMLLSTSYPLPGASKAPDGKPWLGWRDGASRALGDPDRRWEAALIERAKAELEAINLRVGLAVSSLNFECKQSSMVYLFTRGEEARWKLQAFEGSLHQFGEATLVIRRRLGERWEPMVTELRTTPSGAALADLLEKQIGRVHPYPQYKTGTAIIRALLMHPLLLRIQRRPDYLSCLSIYAVHASGDGTIEILLHKLAAVNVLRVLLSLPGFELDQRILTIDVKMAPPAPFVDVEDMPRDVDWTNVTTEEIISYRTLVMTYIDNDNFIAEALNNPRIVSKAGVVPIIAQKSRSMRILSIIANRRDLHTGILNKEVPLSLLENPAHIPVSALRKFIHVRFVDKATLARLGGKGSMAREEIRREVARYLASLK